MTWRVLDVANGDALKIEPAMAFRRQLRDECESPFGEANALRLSMTNGRKG